MLSTNVVTCSYIICHISQWRHNGRGGVSNHQPRHCLLNRLSRRRSKKTSKLRVTCLCVWNSPVTGESSAHMASNAENVSIWWRHHDKKVRAYKGKSNHNHCHKTIDLDTEEMKPGVPDPSQKSMMDQLQFRPNYRDLAPKPQFRTF